MNEYNRLLTKWERILDRVEMNNGRVYPIEIGERATDLEIKDKEREVGYSLPPSYKAVLQGIGKSLSLYYSFSDDTMIPDEFKEIFSGEIDWNLDYLQSLDSLADDLMEDGIDYGGNLRGKLEFSHSKNGDVYAFDMTVEGDEKPVIYWEHEEDKVTYLADSFKDYLVRITELNCVGGEIWQFEQFLTERGLDTDTPHAQKWIQWFDSFSETKLSDVKDDMDKLFEFILYRKKLNEESIDALRDFDKKVLLDFLIGKLDPHQMYIERNVICNMIGKGLGDFAEDWVRSLWQEQAKLLDSRLRAILTSHCMQEEEGLQLVFHQLDREAERGKISGYEALSHLGSFHSRKVIEWMESRVRFPVTDGWNQLFIKSNPSWEDVKRWTKLEERHEVTIIHALEASIRERNSLVIEDLPSKKEIQEFLQEVRSRQKLKRRTEAIDFVVQRI